MLEWHGLGSGYVSFGWVGWPRSLSFAFQVLLLCFVMITAVIPPVLFFLFARSLFLFSSWLRFVMSCLGIHSRVE